MGLIHAGVGAAGGVLADSWRDFFYCNSLNESTLAVKGQKRGSSQGRSSNTRGEDNIISNGSIIAVNEGQCMIIVENGEIVDVCAAPGQFVYDQSSEPSLFYGDLGEGIKATFTRIGQRFAFGGGVDKDQRIYYFNTKEIYGNKYGTQSPIPFRIVDTNLNLDLDTEVRCFGEFSYRIADPLLFYKNVCGNVDQPFTRDRIDSQMRSELLTAMQPALGRISEMGIRYSAIPTHTADLTRALNDVLSESWRAMRGIEITSFAMSSISIPDEDEARIKNLQSAAVMRDPTMAAANLAAARADAMKMAASNEAGAMNGFMGFNMANMAGANDAQLYNQPAQQVPQSAYQVAPNGGFGGYQQAPQQAPQPPQAQNGWKCPECGTTNTMAFCGGCGKPKPAPAAEWTCPKCNTVNNPANRFCGGCGNPKG